MLTPAVTGALRKHGTKNDLKREEFLSLGQYSTGTYSYSPSQQCIIHLHISLLVKDTYLYRKKTLLYLLDTFGKFETKIYLHCNFTKHYTMYNRNLVNLRT